jgi:hypothetical protein
MIVLGKKNVLMQAYGQGMINVQCFTTAGGMTEYCKTFGTCQMQVHIYSPSKQLLKMATA